MREGTKASSGNSRLAAIKKRRACSTTKFFLSPWLSVNRSNSSFVAEEIVAEI